MYCLKFLAMIEKNRQAFRLTSASRAESCTAFPSTPDSLESEHHEVLYMKMNLALSAALLSCLLLAGCAPGASDHSTDTTQPNSSISTPDSTTSTDASDSSNQSSQPEASKQDAIPFTDGQSYAVVHLGYQQIEDLDYYVQQYLDSEDIPIHYLSSGDYYLVIPRYSGMELSLYKNDLETSEPALFYHNPSCEPFIIQCNVSDIFPDATIQLIYQGTTVEFSPFISLKDGSLEIGEHGLNLTRNSSTSPSES